PRRPAAAVSPMPTRKCSTRPMGAIQLGSMSPRLPRFGSFGTSPGGSMRVRAALLLAALVPCTLPLAAQRAIADTDLYAFHWVAGPQVSPDGKQVAYVLVTVNAKRDGYETRIWAVATDGKSPPRRLTAGPPHAPPPRAPPPTTPPLLPPR